MTASELTKSVDTCLKIGVIVETINHLRIKLTSVLQKFISYLTENTMYLHHKDEMVNDVYVNGENPMKHKHTVWKNAVI
jgi:hypothetical protein